MKINIKYMNNINLTTEMSDTVSKGEIKMVKAWMADTKNLLPEYVQNMVAKAEKDLRIGITDIYKLSATYYNSYEMPVIMIVGRGFDRRPGTSCEALFIEAFTDNNEGTYENRYTRAC